MQHDARKDPAHNEFLDTFYSNTRAPNHDKTFYGGMLGKQNGQCTNVHVDESNHIDALIVYHSRGAIRNLEFKFSDGTTKKVGEHQDYTGNLKQEIVNFPHGEEILGIYGKTKTDEITTMKGKFKEDHFASLGFIVNRCDNYKMSQFSSDISKFRQEKQASGSAKENRIANRNGGPDKSGKVTALTAAVAVLSIIVLLGCAYAILKKRGSICKKKQDHDMQAVSQQSTGKKNPRGDLVGQDSFTSVNPRGVTSAVDNTI